MSSNKGKLCLSATEAFVKIFESEVHEGTLIHGLECLQTWFSSGSCREVPEVFVKWIPKGLALKSVTSGVRTAYFVCLLEALTNSISAMTDDKEIEKSMSKIVDNATRQSAQVAIVSEAVHCMACYTKINPDDLENSELMKTVIDPKLALFTSDKFLTGISGSALKSLCFVAEKVILLNMGKEYS